MASKFQTILDECKDELEAIAFFDPVKVLTEFDRETISGEVKDVQALIQHYLADASYGIIVVLLWDQMAIPEAREGESGPVLHNSVLTARVIESTETNVTGVNRLEVCERVKDSLHLFLPQTATAPLCVAAPGIQRWIDDTGMYLGYDVSFVTTDGSGVVVTQVETPTIVYEDLGTPFTVEMLCDTEGAAIFYTTNGKRPNPQNGTLFTGQFVLADPTTLKARAWLSGYRPSEIATATAGTVTPDMPVTFEQIRQAFIDHGGLTQFATDGQLLQQNQTNDRFHRIHVTTDANGDNPSVVAADGETPQP